MSLIRLDDLIINKNLSSVTVDGEERVIEPKLFELLMLFCQHHQHIVSRQQILEAIWPDTIVTDNAVNKLVASLRRLLNDDPKSPRYIQTVPKRGYRLLVEAKIIAAKQNHEQSLSFQQASVAHPQRIPGRRINQKLWLVAALSIVILFAYMLLLWRPSPLEATSTAMPVELKTHELTKMPGLERSPIMSVDQRLLMFLREDKQTGHRRLWQKDLTNEQESLIAGISPYVSRLIDLDEQSQTPRLIYLAQESAQCHVSAVELVARNRLGEDSLLFDCTGMRIFDVVWAPQKGGVYYTAQAEHETVSRVYFYDIDAQSHRLVTQPEASGVGNRGIDLSVDDNQLLIVSLDRDFNSQLYVLDLNTNALKAGLKVGYDIKMATWSHDGEHVLFYDPAPSQQLIKSDIDGQRQQVLFSVSEYLETEFSRIKGSRDLLFATTNLNFNNRWVYHIEQVAEVSNSTVYDMKPTLAHHSLHYAFISTRSGRGQIYFGDLQSGESRVISRLNAHRWFQHLSFSPDDSTLLAGDHGRLWLIELTEQLNQPGILELQEEAAAFTTAGDILSARWLSNEYLYLNIEIQGTIKGHIWGRQSRQLVELENRWQVLISDHNSPDTLYLVDQFDREIYQMPMEYVQIEPGQEAIKFSAPQIQALGSRIAADFNDVKLHDGSLYYVTASNSGNSLAYDYQIEVMPLISRQPVEPQVYKTSCSCGYDIADSGFMLSEQVHIEGDIRRTVQN